MDQSGGVGEEVTEDQVGGPEREMEVTVQPRETADLQMRVPGGREGGWLLVECFWGVGGGKGKKGRKGGGGKANRGSQSRRRRRFFSWTFFGLSMVGLGGVYVGSYGSELLEGIWVGFISLTW